MRPAQCPFAKEVFSEDETIFLVWSPKDKYDVDSVDMGFVWEEKCSVLRPEQTHDVHLGLICELCPGANSVAGSGPDIWSLTWAQSRQFNVVQSSKQLARKWREEVYSFTCFCCFLSTGKMLSLLVVSPVSAETTPEIIILSLAPLVKTICGLNNLFVPLGPFLPSLCYICAISTSDLLLLSPASASVTTRTATSDLEISFQVRSLWEQDAELGQDRANNTLSKEFFSCLKDKLCPNNNRKQPVSSYEL